jgi:hypothetical protein
VEQETQGARSKGRAALLPIGRRVQPGYSARVNGTIIPCSNTARRDTQHIPGTSDKSKEPTDVELRAFFGLNLCEYRRLRDKAAETLREKELLYDQTRNNASRASKEENLQIGLSMLQRWFPDKAKTLPTGPVHERNIRCFVVRQLKVGRRTSLEKRWSCLVGNVLSVYTD